MRILVIDVGGSSVKFTIWGTRVVRTIPTDRQLAAVPTVKQILFLTDDWKYDAVSIGFPGLIIRGKITDASSHLGDGWNGFDFSSGWNCTPMNQG